MADLVDRSPDYNAFALANHLNKQSGGGQGATHCDECGEKIPVKRQAAQPGCRMCVECQAELEE